MKKWLKGIGGAVGMGLLWALGGALAAVPMEAFIDPDGAIVDIWPAVLAIPSFFGGLIFFLLLRIAERRRKLAELPLSRAAAWGAVTGLLLPLLFTLVIEAGAGTVTVNGHIPWRQAAAIVGSMILGFSVAASASVALARKVETAW